ncbi:MAG: flippase-like domain-containing protein [Ignavibacteriales bacterium]|nr:flippase-like domain-containing protein [Ignavibacteriales bacterium]
MKIRNIKLLTSDNMFIGKIKKIFSYSFPVLLMLIFLYMAFSNINFSEVLSLIGNMSVYWFVIYLLVWFFSHVIRAYRWKIIIKSVKENTSIFNLFSAVMVGYGVNCVVPRLGELYRGLFLGRWENISRSSMVGTIVVERVIDILVLGISVLISVAVYSGNLFTQISWLKSTVYVGFTVIIGIIVFLILIVRFKENFYNAILKFVGKFSHKLADLLAKGFHLLTEGFSSLKGTKNITMVVLLSVFIMYLYGLTAYFSLLSLHMDKYQPVSYSMAWIIMTISAFGIIIPTPGATGSYHLIVISVLVNLYSFNNEISGAFAILTHTSTYILFILSTVILTIIINNNQKRKGMPVANFLTAFRSKEKLQ